MVTMALAQQRLSLFLMVTRDLLVMLRTAAALGLYRLPFPLPGPGVSTKVVSTVKVLSGVVFVGIEFGCEGLEIRVQAFTPFFEFTHGEGGGLEGVGEGTGLHGKMDRGVRGQRGVGGNLSLDGSTQGVRQFFPEIVVGGDISVLLKGGFEPLFVQDVSPVATSTHRS